MARRKASFAHNLEDANPYEPWHRKVSPYHREHRSKKGRHVSIPHYSGIVEYRKKLQRLKEQELNEDEEQAFS